MSARGDVFIASTDNNRLLGSDYIAEYLSLDIDYLGDEIALGYVDYLDSKKIIDFAPDVAWFAFMGDGCEESNILWVYTPHDESGFKENLMSSFKTKQSEELSGGVLSYMLHVHEEPVIRTSHRNSDEAVYTQYVDVIKKIPNTTRKV